MPTICYVQKTFSSGTQSAIDAANGIIEEYSEAGFTLTLRQLYYQFVSRDLIANNLREYKRLGSIINDARLAGEIDWDAIEDRTRGVRGNAHWTTPADIIDSAASGFRVDRWEGQPNYVEVWIEKDALVGVAEKVCRALDVKYLSCRGYTSQSEMWEAGQRFAGRHRKGQQTHILHLGDHDPSGIDMTRDIEERLRLFCTHHRCEPPAVHRIALNMDQIERYEPPPNPAKTTDSRSGKYIEQFGHESWELDALDVKTLSELIQSHVEDLLDRDLFDERERTESAGRNKLRAAASRWDEVSRFLNRG
jgi:hypothetical protein